MLPCRIKVVGYSSNFESTVASFLCPLPLMRVQDASAMQRQCYKSKWSVEKTIWRLIGITAAIATFIHPIRRHWSSIGIGQLLLAVGDGFPPARSRRVNHIFRHGELWT